MTEYLGGRLRINEVSPAYWQVTIDNPPINMYDPRMFAALNQLMDRIDAADELRIVVFDSANADYFIAHFDIAKDPEDGRLSFQGGEYLRLLSVLTMNSFVNVDFGNIRSIHTAEFVENEMPLEPSSSWMGVGSLLSVWPSASQRAMQAASERSAVVDASTICSRAVSSSQNNPRGSAT